MRWHVSSRADRSALRLADRHYNRQKVGSPQFVPPGRCLVLITKDRAALWVTSWPFAEYVQHAWAGAWVCSIFRREKGGLASDGVREAVAATCSHWPESPRIGAWHVTRRHDRSLIERVEVTMVTFIDPERTRRKRDPGRCFRRAGFVDIGGTKGGLVALGLPTPSLPTPEAAYGENAEISFEAVS